MTPRRVYYIRYIDPKTGFQKREEFETQRARANRIAELTEAGIKTLMKGSYLTS